MNTDQIIQKEIDRIRDEIIEKFFPVAWKGQARTAIDEFTKRLQKEILSEEREIYDLKRENKSWRDQREAGNL